MKNKYFYLLLLSAVARQASAQGYQVDELSVRRLGDGFSGGAASANDASTAHYNPAGLTHLTRTEVMAGVTALSNKASFRGEALAFDPANTSGSGTGSAPLSGGDSAVTDTRAIIPNVYAALPLDASTVLGFTFNTPFGSGTDYPLDDVTRYQAGKSNVEDLRLGLSVGKRLDSRVSLGASLLADRLSGEIENAIPSSAFCSLLESLTSAGACANAGIAAAGSAQNDGNVKLTSHDLAFGYALGVLLDVDAATRFGVAYKSKVKHKLEGSADFTVPANVEALIGPFSSVFTTHKEDASLDITTPASLSFSGFHQYNDKLSVQADVTWTQWNVFKTLTIEGQNDTIMDQAQYWKNNWRVAVGGDYQLDSLWTVRAGLSWDQSPLKKERRSLSFPLDDYRAISLGASYSLSPQWTLDLATQKTFDFNADVNEGSLADDGANVKGRVHSQSWSVAAGIRWKS